MNKKCKGMVEGVTIYEDDQIIIDNQVQHMAERIYCIEEVYCEYRIPNGLCGNREIICRSQQASVWKYIAYLVGKALRSRR